MSYSTEKPAENALLVGLSVPGITTWEAEDSLDELARLTDTATIHVVGRMLQARKHIDATYYIGKGKAHELKDQAKSTKADMIIFDNDLSPAQMRNLEELCETRVIDRSAIILDIFVPSLDRPLDASVASGRWRRHPRHGFGWCSWSR